MKRSAAELDELLRQALRSIGPASTRALAAWLANRSDGMPDAQIYRVLKRLVDGGEVQHCWLASSYFVVERFGAGRLALVCRSCGDVRPVAAGDLHGELRERAHAAGFSVLETIVETSGVCASCAKP